MSETRAKQAFAKHALRAAERHQIYLLAGPHAVDDKPTGMYSRRVSEPITESMHGTLLTLNKILLTGMIMTRQGIFVLSIASFFYTSISLASSDEPEPVYADVKMEGLPYEGENCEGGDWSVHWKGPVYVENGPLADLLISYTAFDTSHPGQRPIPSVKFSSKKVTCRDNDGKVVMTGTINQRNSNKIQLTVSLAQNAAFNSPAFIFSADEMGACKVNASGNVFDYPNVMTSIHTGALNSISPALDITLDDLKKGFNKTYKFDGTVVGIAPLCMGHQLKSGSVNLRYKSGDEDPTVALDACLHLAKNETREITAQGSPDGGNYLFSSNPSNVLTINRQQKNTASILGTTPGKGDVTVEYTRNGKTASTTVAGSVVDLVSINNGSAIPKLGLYDVEGKKIGTTYSFPLKLDPVDGYVQMTLENDVLASVVNTSTNIQIQPVKLGKTVMQAKTLCGSKIGSPIPIEIVRCDDEVQQQLRTKKEAHKQRLDTIVKRITGLTGDSEFQRAGKEIAKTTTEMAIKTGETIINTLTFNETRQIEFAAKNGIFLSKEVIVNGKALEIAGTAWDALNLYNDAKEAYDNPADRGATLKAAIGAAVLISQKQAIALAKTYIEAGLAAEKFGQDLGILVGVADQLAELEPQHNKLIKEYIHISDHLAFCEKSPPPPKPDEPKPQPPEPAPDDETEIPVEELPPDEIPTEEAPEPEEPKQPPKEEDPPKKVYGLACRIQDLKAPGTAQALRELKQLYVAQQQSLAKAKAELTNWQTALEKMKLANEGTATEREAEFLKFEQSHQQFLLNSAQQGAKSLEFMMETEECPERLEIKFDQIRARYN